MLACSLPVGPPLLAVVWLVACPVKGSCETPVDLVLACWSSIIGMLLKALWGHLEAFGSVMLKVVIQVMLLMWLLDFKCWRERLWRTSGLSEIVPSLKGRISIIEFNSWLHVGPPKFPILCHDHCPGNFRVHINCLWSPNYWLNILRGKIMYFNVECSVELSVMH